MILRRVPLSSERPGNSETQIFLSLLFVSVFKQSNKLRTKCRAEIMEVKQRNYVDAWKNRTMLMEKAVAHRPLISV